VSSTNDNIAQYKQQRQCRLRTPSVVCLHSFAIVSSRAPCDLPCCRLHVGGVWQRGWQHCPTARCSKVRHGAAHSHTAALCSHTSHTPRITRKHARRRNHINSHKDTNTNMHAHIAHAHPRMHAEAHAFAGVHMSPMPRRIEKRRGCRHNHTVCAKGEAGEAAQRV
jgi:hypothetical protein